MKKKAAAAPFAVYILRCRDGTLYTGFTRDLEKRLQLHNTGRGAKYTRSRRPVELAWSKPYRRIRDAMAAEVRIKRMTRKKKESLLLKKD